MHLCNGDQSRGIALHSQSLQESGELQRDQNWRDLKDEIYEVYIKNDNTLEETMAAIHPKVKFHCEVNVVCI